MSDCGTGTISSLKSILISVFSQIASIYYLELHVCVQQLSLCVWSSHGSVTCSTCSRLHKRMGHVAPSERVHTGILLSHSMHYLQQTSFHDRCTYSANCGANESSPSCIVWLCLHSCCSEQLGSYSKQERFVLEAAITSSDRSKLYVLTTNTDESVGGVSIKKQATALTPLVVVTVLKPKSHKIMLSTEQGRE